MGYLSTVSIVVETNALQAKTGSKGGIIAANGSTRVKCRKGLLTIMLCKLKLQRYYLLRRVWCFSFILHIYAAYDRSNGCSLRIEGNNIVDEELHSRFVENK